MMGGGAFILLKAGRTGPESAKQPETCLADLQKILRIALPRRRSRAVATHKKARALAAAQNFRWIWLIWYENYLPCWLDHRFSAETELVN